MHLFEKGPLVLDYLTRLGAKDTYKAKFESLMQAVDAAPAVEAEPVRHGTWQVWHGDCMRRDGKMQGFRYYECSECWRRTAVKSNYCPNCGVRMY